MAKKLVNGTDTSIGAFVFSDRKKPCLCVEKGNRCVVYAHFISAESADEFMNELAEFLRVHVEV